MSRQEKAGEEQGGKSLDLSLCNKITFMSRFNERVIPQKRDKIPGIFGTKAGLEGKSVCAYAPTPAASLP